MKLKNAKEIAKIDRLEAEFATIKKRADELTAQYKRLSQTCLKQCNTLWQSILYTANITSHFGTRKLSAQNL